MTRTIITIITNLKWRQKKLENMKKMQEMEGTEKIEKTEMEEMQEIKDTEEMEKIGMEEMQEPSQKQYPVHHVPDDAQPVEAALDPVHRLLLAQVVAQVAEVAVQEDLPLSLCLDHHLPLLILLLGSHIVQLPLWADRQEKKQCFLSTHSDSRVMQRRNDTWAAAAVLHSLSNSDFFTTH